MKNTIIAILYVSAYLIPCFASGQNMVMPASRSGFSDCFLEQPVNENSKYSSYLFLPFRLESNSMDTSGPLSFMLIRLNELYKIFHKTRGVDECHFKEIVDYYIESEYILTVSRREMDALIPFKKNKSDCSNLSNMNLNEFISAFFERDKFAQNSFHSKSNLHLTRDEKDCIFIKLFENRIVSNTDSKGYIILRAKPCYVDN